MKRTAAVMAAALGLAAGLTLLTAGPALAHEVRRVGAYQFIVGFGDEPPYAGLKNSVQLTLSKGGKPVTDLTDSLKVEVIVGTQKMLLPLEATFDPDTGIGTPGDYRAWFIPTAPGKYTFHFFGSIGTQNIDQSFASGPTTFNDVVDPAQVEFPAKVPSGAQIAARLDREVPRLTNAIQAVDGRSADRAGSARTLALVGVVLGGLGLALGGTAFVVARRRVSTPPPPAPAERHLTPEAERS